MLGVEFPILAFSHCRDVVAAVSNAGGFGVLGAVAHTPDQLEVDLTWIEEQTHGRPYGLDLLLPQKYEGADEGGITRDTLAQLLPPTQQAGVDVIVAQGTEAGGHTGEISTMVLVPEVVAAVAPTPVLAAGGIATGRQIAAAMALGAEGVWCGSVWLTTEEAETQPAVKQKFLAATSKDTVRSRSLTGKPARMLRSAWTDEWDKPDAPPPLQMPLQTALVAEAQLRINKAATNKGSGAQELANYFVGQVVGQLDRVRPARQVVLDMVTEYAEVAQSFADQVAETAGT